MEQIGKVVVQNTKRRLYVGCLTALIGIPTIICGFIFLFTVVLPGMEEIVVSGNDEIVPFILLGTGVVLIFLFLVLPVIIYMATIHSRAKKLDAIFLPLGLKGEMYLIVGRHYWGSLNGREVDVYIYRGPSMEIHISSHSNTRLLIVPDTSLPSKLSGIFNKPPMAINNPDYAKYSLYPDDENWARELIQMPETLSIFESLVFGHADWAIFRHLEIHADRIMLYLHRSKQLFSFLDQFSVVNEWLKSMQSLAELIDKLPQPAIITNPILAYSRERKQKTNKFQLYVILFILICVPILCIGVGVLVYFLSTL